MLVMCCIHALRGPISGLSAPAVRMWSRPVLCSIRFSHLLEAPPPGQAADSVPERGRLQISQDLDECLSGADALMGLPLPKALMSDHLLTTFDRYHRYFGFTHERLRRAFLSNDNHGGENRSSVSCVLVMISFLAEVFF